MRPAVKVAVGLVAAVAIIFTAAALYLALVFDANRYKPEVTAAARGATGRELAIDGDLALGLFPQPHVRVGAVRLANPPGFDGAMVEWESARAIVALLPLLRRHVQIDELAVERLNIQLLKNRKGQDNWSDLTSKQEGSKGDQQFRVSIHGIRLMAATVSYRDESKKNQVSLSEIEVRTGRLGGAEPAPVQLDA